MSDYDDDIETATEDEPELEAALSEDDDSSEFLPGLPYPGGLFGGGGRRGRRPKTGGDRG